LAKLGSSFEAISQSLSAHMASPTQSLEINAAALQMQAHNMSMMQALIV